MIISAAAPFTSRTLPPGFVIRAKGTATSIIGKKYEESILSSEILTGAPRYPAAGLTPLSGGRGSAWELTLPGIGAVVLRRYRRGGLLGKVLFDRYLSGFRPFQELSVLAFARSHGVPVPEVLGASSSQTGILFHRGRIATRLIPGSTTLAAFIAAKRDKGRLVTDVLKRTGAAIRTMHEAGIRHADLNMNNILVDGGRSVFIIDFDKATIRRKLGQAARIRNLRRLLRSARKLAGLGLNYSDTDFETILGGYCEGEKGLLEELRDSTLGSRLTALRGSLSRILHRLL